MKTKIIDFLNTNPTEDEIDAFYCNKVLLFDKRSIDEILND